MKEVCQPAALHRSSSPEVMAHTPQRATRALSFLSLPHSLHTLSRQEVTPVAMLGLAPPLPHLIPSRS
jgi:hypothetical protein